LLIRSAWRKAMVRAVWLTSPEVMIPPDRARSRRH